MLAERRDMAKVVAEHPSIRAWLAARFQSSEQAIVWDSTLPESGQPAEHLPPAAPGMPVRVRVAPRWSGSDQLSMVCFELLNARNDDAVLDLWAKADAGLIEGEAFAAAMTQLELSAVQSFAALAKEHGLSPGPNDVVLRQLIAAPTTLPEYRVWVRQFAGYDAEAYHRRMFEERRAKMRALGSPPPAPSR